MNVERIDLAEWERMVPDGCEVFHTPEALSVLAEHAAGELHLLGAKKGEQPLALVPAFVRQSAVGTAVFSPPPGMGVPRLGPLLMPTSPKRRKREKLNREFTAAVVKHLVGEGSRTLFRMECPAAYDDPRPYRWTDFDVESAFTYVLAVDGDTDALLSSFSKSLRREIRDAEELSVGIETEGLDGARAVFEDTRARYAEQDEPFALEWPYVRDLLEALGDRARVYVARDPDGRFLSGITVLYSNDMAYFWQGGARATYEGTSVNSALHWRILEDLATDPELENVYKYDLMGANTERLCRYKAKFSADLVPYYVIESNGPAMTIAKTAYSLLR
ncbi:lipid II:glycine glycyltransferase FemX [Halalkalicoccus jeotgali]|uniref:BioF2-like acetyltransferase domain-containing protein n=1 Tax=Halalkalicoccus jeotgali (strain DSM 18796 / CECT 7217 / JCM 14584 / KCTC 4019 / B3) TaxID=795797 RepID=D8J458_HALJB|nr:GNAT family N-acetyltransferase [Halalkalicoccus jeotgali]ADJ15450.1 hypothetical protein HacjB3_10335 [Halalkalicoccus jeotgali B3]ELY36141.1 hypothetical protein C497_12332 [Halalkalicoccus jeotgali B3]